MSEPIIVLRGVHGRDTQGPQARALGALRGVSLALGPGVHAFVGRPRDGTAALCELLAGRRRPSAGALSIGGRDPARNAALRRNVGTLLLDTDLPLGDTVARALEQIGAIRRADLRESLDGIGAAGLAPRTLRSLERDEARTVMLAAMLAVPDVLALALCEPFGLRADPRLVHERIRAVAERGAAVVIATCAPEDLGALPDHVHLLEAGRLWGSDHEVGWGVGQGRTITLWIEAAAARDVAATLAERKEVAAVSLDAVAEGLAVVSVRGADLDEAAIAIAETVAASGAEVAAMQSALPDIVAMQQAARAHRAALHQAPGTAGTPRTPDTAGHPAPRAPRVAVDDGPP